MEAKLLTEKSRLQEIYDLRVAAYEESPYAKFINREKYPHGYFDELDPLDSTYHWIVEDEQNNIIGAVRAAVLTDLAALEEDVAHLDLPQNVPFAYCGRTAVHPKARGGRVMLQLDHAIRNFIADNSSIKFALCFVIPERANAVVRLGFHSIGFVQYDWGNGEETALETFLLNK
ncbi:lysophospholipid acyltransferase family protein [Hymenobacter properus]|uniref:N-acetyltransferase domain-containing protein n=1 Tax=Hymenobacter properus TaxID=2791026 RepID=A0A931BJ65_9BACT|nr:hypothetical protein [Hymenobacter properus]MBF9141183.1 hypothetical protein [Hymenobacter properus]MBR7719992.1 hypothetical protein [Microvirga sp. SRT04]